MGSPGGLTGRERVSVTAMLNIIREICRVGSNPERRRTDAGVRQFERYFLPSGLFHGMTRLNMEA
jgi:hypothetical protein